MAEPDRGRRAGRPRVFLLVLAAVLGTVGCWPFPSMQPEPTPTPGGPATPTAGGVATPTAGTGGAETPPATAGVVELPPPPTWPPPPAPQQTGFPATLATPGPG